MKHSKIVGSSTAARRYHCPGSIDLEADIPEPPESSYAAEGTALHSAMEHILWNDTTPGSCEGMEFYGMKVSKDQVPLLEFCDAAFARDVGGKDFQLETTYSFPGIEGAFGTGDVCWFDDDAAGVMDWKFGGGVQVTTPGNMQAKFLLCGMRATEKLGRDVRLYATFVQPRFDYAEKVEFTHDELDAFEADLRHAVHHRRYEDNNLKAGSHCKFCKATITCPARHETARKAAQWKTLMAQDIPRALAMVEDVEQWAAAVRKAAHEALEAGATVQGWKLVNKRGRRDWDPEIPVKSLERRLAKRGLLKSDRYTTKLITPPQAEKLLGREKLKKMGVVVDIPGNGTTLAREDDKRPAVVIPDRSPSNLFEAMQSAKAKQKDTKG